VQRSMTVVHEGEQTWPPPPVTVSAAPAAPAPAPAAEPAAPQRRRRLPAFVLLATGAVALFLLTAFSPDQLIANFTVFALAVVIGYYVIGNVHHALHTPLMSVTNAISGIVVVGALLQIGHGHAVVTVLSAVAILLASINVFGGFAVTRRMLGMFSKG
jgi:H+-translocating NAD(P) transhydrogenase subunit alpha